MRLVGWPSVPDIKGHPELLRFASAENVSRGCATRKGQGHLISLNVRKRLIGSEGSFELRVKFTVPEGRLAVLYGVSGAGKTTLLRMLAGLEQPDDGCIEIAGKAWFDRKQRVCVPPQKRSVGMVFQNYALFPSMTVRRNLEFAAGRRKDPRVDMLLDMVELRGIAAEVSGRAVRRSAAEGSLGKGFDQAPQNPAT